MNDNLDPRYPTEGKSFQVQTPTLQSIVQKPSNNHQPYDQPSKPINHIKHLYWTPEIKLELSL